MSKNSETIKEYLKNNLIGDKTITQLSSEIGVSVSAMTRYAQIEGFNGFKELKYFYNKNKYLESEEVINQLLLNTVFSSKRTSETIDRKKIDLIAKKITEKENIVILGEAFTFIAAQYFERLLRKININASVRNVASELTVLSPQKDTMFIFLSMSGMNKNIKKAAQKLYSGRVPGQMLVSITSNNYSNIKEIANEWIAGYIHQENTSHQYELPSVGNSVLNLIIYMIFAATYEINKVENDKMIKMIAFEKEK